MGETERDTRASGEGTVLGLGGLIKVKGQGLGLGTGPRAQDNKTHPLLDQRGSGEVFVAAKRWKNRGWGLTLLLFCRKVFLSR